MSGAQAETSYRLSADGSELMAQLLRARKGMADTGAAAKKMQGEIKATTSLGATAYNLATATTSLGATAYETGQQIAAGAKTAAKGTEVMQKGMNKAANSALLLSQQVQDFTIQVQGGGNPITAFAQQFSQLQYQFGGTQEALNALKGLFTPLRIALGLGAGAVATLGYAFYKAGQEEAAFRKNMQLTANAAGFTSDSFDRMAESLAKASNGKTNVREMKTILGELAATGRFSAESIEQVAAAAATLAEVSGKESKDIVADFAKMKDGVAQWAQSANKQYHYLTGAQYAYIRQLEAQGEKEKAVAENSRLLNEALKRNQRQLGFLETSWKGVTTWAAKAWDAMLNVGKSDTLTEQLEKAQQALDAMIAANPAGLNPEFGTGASEADIERQRQFVENLRARVQLEKVAAEASSKLAAAEEKKIDEQSSARESAQAALLAAQAQRRAAARDFEIEKASIALERGYDDGLKSAMDYQAARYAIDKAALTSRLQLINDESAAAKANKPDSPEETTQAAARELAFDVQRIAIKKELLALDEKKRRAEFQRPRDSLQEAQETEELAMQQRRVDAAFQAAVDLKEQNKQLNVDLIKDDEQRGLAQIELDRIVLEKRMDFAALDVEERKKAEEELAAWLLARQKRLTEELKPEWQRRLEDWKDSTKAMKESYDTFMGGLMDKGFDIWDKFTKTGKLSFKSIGEMARTEINKIVFKDLFAGSIEGFGKSLAGVLGVKTKGGTAATGAADAVKEQTDMARQASEALKMLKDSAGGVVNGFMNLMSSIGSGASGAFSSLAGLFTGSSGGAGAGAGAGADYGQRLGGAWDGGVQFFRDGGIVDRPTRFRFGKGGSMRGIMGEAGPEAIVPLKRGKDGKLGVGGGGGNVFVTNVGGASVSTEKKGPDWHILVETAAEMGAKRGAERAYNRVVNDHASGTGRSAMALKRRGVDLNRGLDKRG